MAEKMTNKTTGRPANKGTSNSIRTVLFAFVLICFGAFVLTNMSYGGPQKTEVPISEVIARANDANGDIDKITVTG